MDHHLDNQTYYDGNEDDPLFVNSHYTQDISEQMRVPKRIKATGEIYDDFDTMPNGNGIYTDKYDMTVPDRIVVIGQDQHLGTRSAPREIVLDNSILPASSPTYVRVSTPPRTITLSEHHFPSASDGPPKYTPDDDDDDDDNNDHRHQQQQQQQHNGIEYNSQSSFGYDDRRMMPMKTTKNSLNQDLMNLSRETTPPLHGELLSTADEVVHLRRQLAKLNRRILSIEIDNVQRQQRDKIVYCIGLAYFFVRAFMWLSKD